jgi:hypothetical protein
MNLIQDRSASVTLAHQILIASENRSELAINFLRDSVIREFHSLWNNPRATAVEQLAIIGTNAKAAFAQHRKYVLFLLSEGVAMDASDYTPPVAYTEHADGTITLD